MNSQSMKNGVFKFVGKTGFVMLVVFITQSLPARAQKRPLTVADMIEMRSIVTSNFQPILLSPDGRHYLIVFQSGDLQRNGSWIEFWSGETPSLAAAKPMQIVKLFTSSTVRANDLVKELRWLGNNEVTFLWEDGVHPSNLKVLNIQTRRLRTLAERSTSIVEYSISKDGNELVYTARHPHTARNPQAQHEGVVISDESIWSLLGKNPEKDKMGDADQYETFIVAPPSAKPHQVTEPAVKWFTHPELLSLSPVGHYAVAVRPAVRIPEAWDAYTDHIFKDIYLPSARNGSGQGNWIRQYELINLATAKARPLWGAPMNPWGNVVWSPDGKSIVVGPTFLPVSGSDAAGLAGEAVAIIDVHDGSFVELPLPNHESGHKYAPVAWSSDGIVTLEATDIASGKSRRLNFRKNSEGWRPAKEPANSDAKTEGAIRVVVRQDLNTPPALFAIDARTRKEKKVLEINPALQRIEVGRVESFHWQDSDGRHWTGVLYYPIGFQSGKRYPLVIQTHGYSPTEFSLAGSHLTTVFAAQPLAAAGIMVLQLGGPDEDVSSLEATPREPEMALAGFESAINQLVSDGMVDSKRVGIAGFSRTGWYVEYALTHSSVDFAAAIVADNIDGGYLQYVLGDPNQRAEFEKDAGGRPFGEGLQVWLRNAPGFLADRVRCPVRFELDSGPASEVIEEWELFSHLRYLHKPAELFVIPDIEHGVHVLQNPAQRMASEGGAVDWFRFWLKGEEDLGKERQYRRWRKLRSLSEVGHQ